MRTSGGWSMRELASIAGTSLKTVRYYHRIGLLEEPERAANGYKQYKVTHLIRLLRIRRLVDLGVTLSDIATIEESDEGAEQIFRALDSELAASIERQQRIRAELAVILRHRNLAELPQGFDANAGDLSDADRAFLLLSERIFEPWVVDLLRELHTKPRSEAAIEFDTLTDEADEATRQSVAERYAPEIQLDHQNHPGLTELAERGPAGDRERTWSVFRRGVAELHNAAQIDVLQRINALIEREAGSP